MQFDLGGGSTTEKSARVSMASESMVSENMVHSMASESWLKIWGALRRAKGKNFVENRGPFNACLVVPSRWTGHFEGRTDIGFLSRKTLAKFLTYCNLLRDVGIYAISC